MHAPYVFISYSHDAAQHMAVVLDFSDRLREEGIDANIDQYDDAPSEGWPRWMMNQLDVSDHVLVVCTQHYDRRFRGKEQPSKGLGASWEGAIITQEIYSASGNTTKFIPIIFDTQDAMYIPVVLQGTTYYDLSKEEAYEKLYRRLTNQPFTRKPDLGRITPMATRTRRQTFVPVDGVAATQDSPAVYNFDASPGAPVAATQSSESKVGHMLSVAVVPSDRGYVALCIDLGVQGRGKTVQDAIHAVVATANDFVESHGMPTEENAPIISHLIIPASSSRIATAPDSVGLIAHRFVESAYLPNLPVFWSLLSKESQGIWQGIWNANGYGDLGDLHIASLSPDSPKFSGLLGTLARTLTDAWGPEYGTDRISLTPTRYDSIHQARVRIALGFDEPEVISSPRLIPAITIPMVRENGEWRVDYLAMITPASLM